MSEVFVSTSCEYIVCIKFVYDIVAIQPLHNSQPAGDLGSESLRPNLPPDQACRREGSHVEDRGDGVQRLELLVEVLHLSGRLRSMSAGHRR